MLRKYCRRFLSLGFASLIEPIQPSGNITQNTNLYRKSLCDKVRALQLRCFMSSRSQLLANSNGSMLCIYNKERTCNSVKEVTCRQALNKHFSSSICLSNKSVNSNKTNAIKEGSDIEPEEEDDTNLTIFQRFKSTYKKHGKILLCVHVATSAVWFASFYYVARSGLDVVAWMEAYNFPPNIISPFKHAGLGDLAVMYLLYKVATPIRYTVTLGGTNLTIRYLKRTGYIEPVKPEDSIRSLMKDGSDVLKERRSEFIEQRREKIKSWRDKDKDSQ